MLRVMSVVLLALCATARGGEKFAQIREHLRASRDELALHEGRSVGVLVGEERQNGFALRKHGAR